MDRVPLEHARMKGATSVTGSARNLLFCREDRRCIPLLFSGIDPIPQRHDANRPGRGTARTTPLVVPRGTHPLRRSRLIRLAGRLPCRTVPCPSCGDGYPVRSQRSEAQTAAGCRCGRRLPKRTASGDTVPRLVRYCDQALSMGGPPCRLGTPRGIPGTLIRSTGRKRTNAVSASISTGENTARPTSMSRK